MTDTGAEIPTSVKKSKKAKKRQRQDATGEQREVADQVKTDASECDKISTNANVDEKMTQSNPFATEESAKKKKKFKKSVENAAQQPDNEGTDEMIGLMPKPVVSKRQKKKLKKIQTTHRDVEKEIERTVAYLTKWKSYRDEWKYEKLRQIFVQKSVFDAKVFDEDQSKIAIEYLATSKGAARDNIVKRAEEIISKIDDKITDENSEELTSSVPYIRAREILQLMQD